MFSSEKDGHYIYQEFILLARKQNILQPGYGNKVGQIRSGGPSRGFKDDFLRSGGGLKI